MEWPALLIPLIGAVACFYLFGKRLTWWEVCLPLVAGVMIICIGKAGAEWTQTRDTEYWGAYVTEATYYERWNERVSCRHPRYRTESYTYPCGTKDKPRTCTGTRQVKVGYMHLYDVDDHRPRWEATDSNGKEWSLSEKQWKVLCEKFGNRTFRDMHRSYYSVDGDAYFTKWPGEWEAVEPVVSTHTYENRVAASDKVIHYPPITDAEAKQKGLYRYPTLAGYRCPSVLAKKTWAGSEDLAKLNALYGRRHEVRVWLLIFEDAPAEMGDLQEAYWKRGNKNELVITVGVNPEGIIQWQHVFCWCDDQSITVDTESYLASGSKLEITALTEWLKPEIDTKWKRKRFRDFNYLTVKPSPAAITTLYVLVTLTTVGICIWSVHNKHDA